MANNVEGDRLLKGALLHPSVALYPNEEEGGWMVHAGSVKLHLLECGSSWLWKTNDGSVLPVRADVADLLKQQVRVIRERRDYIAGIRIRRLREDFEADLIKDKKGE